MKYIIVFLILLLCLGCGEKTKLTLSEGKMVPRQHNWEPPDGLPPGWKWQFRHAWGNMPGGWMAYPPAPGNEYSWVYGPDGKPIMMHGGKIVEKVDK